MFRRFLTVFLLLPLFLTAAVQWQENGIPVRQGDHIENLKTLSLDDGSFVNIWNDCRDGEMGIYAQKVNNEGETLWEETGIEIKKTDHMLYIKDVITTSDNAIVICWRDVWDDATHTDQHFLQKFDASGNPSWDYPVVISYPDGYLLPKMVSADDGSIIVAYYSSALHKIKAVKYLHNGTLAEGWDNIDMLNTYDSYFEIATDLEGGLIVASRTIYTDLYIQRLDESGNKLWGTFGILLQNGSDINYLRKINITSVDSNHYRISWSISDLENNYKIRMQNIDGTGNSNWNNPAEIDTENISYLSVNLLEDFSSIVLWRSNYDLLMNKIDSNGNLLWENTIISESQEYHLNFSYKNVVLDCEGNIGLIWVERNNSINSFYFQKIDQDGNFLLTTPGLLIYETEYSNLYYNLSLNDASYYVSWICDEDNEQKIKQQILSYDGTIQLEDMGEEFQSGIDGFCRSLVMLGKEDNPIMLWEDHRNRDGDQIYMQILNCDGTPLLAENGIPITTFSGNDQEDVHAAVGINSEVIAAIWAENSGQNCKVSVQGLDSSGSYLWSDDTGVELESLIHDVQYQKIDCYDNNGIDEFYTGWCLLGTSWSYDIHAQKIVDGIPQWDEPVVIADEPVDCILLDVNDRFYLWKSGPWGQPDLRLKLLDENGSTAENWPDEGLQIAEVSYSYYYGDDTAKMSLLDNGVFISWTKHESDNTGIYGQIIDYEGNTLWEEGGKLLYSGNNVDQSSHLVIGDNIYITWLDHTYSVVHFLQRVDMEGETIWPENILITPDTYNSGKAVLSAVDNDVLLVWEYSENYDHTMLKAQMISPEGELAYDLDGIMVADGFKRQTKQLVYTNGSEAYVSWIDGRSTYFSEGVSSYDNIYAQKLLLSPTYNQNDVIESSTLQLSNHPNPFNPTTTISFELNTENSESTEIEIYNIKGQKIKFISCHTEPEEGRHSRSVTWDGTDSNNNPVSSGIYFAVLKQKDKVLASRKMMLLK